MSNSILDSQYSSPNALLTSHGFPVNTSGNTVLLSHSPAGTYPDPGGGSPDTTPAAIDFGSLTGQTRSASNIESPNTVTVLEVTAATPITFNFTGSGQWQKNGGSWSSAASDTAVLNDTLKLRHDISASYGGVVTSTITFSPSGVTSTFTTTAEADPAVFSAVLNTSTGVMTLTGTGFGVKTTYAPTWLKSWYGVAHDTLATNAAVGLDRYHTDNPQPRITTAEAGFGGNPLRLYHPIPDGLNEGYSLHPQKFIAPTTEVLMSHWMKISCSLPWSGGLPQIKHHRVGYGQDSSAYDNYENINPRVGITKVHHSSDLSLPLISEDEKPRYWATSTSGTTGDLYDQPTNPTDVAYDTWVFIETYFKWNDVGSTNGIVETWVNNQLYCSSVHRGTPYAVRLAAGDTIRNVQFMPGIQSINTGSPYINPDFTVLLSRPFVDSGSQSRRQVFLGDEATLSACKGKFMLPATSWGDTEIIVNECRSIPSGFDYVYITDDSGAVITSGTYDSV